MNPIYRAAGELATGGTLMGVVTLAFFTFFTLVLLRMFRPSAKLAYAEIARIPLDSHDDAPALPKE